jgi:hypothetical protein
MPIAIPPIPACKCLPPALPALTYIGTLRAGSRAAVIFDAV